MYRVFFKLSIIFFLLTIVGCNNPDQNIESKELKSNLIQSYIEEAKNKKNSEEERKNSLEKAYGIYSTLIDNSYKVEKIHEISFVYFALKDYDNYKEMNEKALKLSNSINDSLNIAKSYAYLGIYYRKSKSELDLALKNFHEADKIYSSLNGQKYAPEDYAFDHGSVLLDLALILRKTKDYSESESVTIKAIEKFELSKSDMYFNLCYSNLGIVAKYLERYDEAVDYHLKVIEYAKGTKKEVYQTLVSYNNIGTVYKSQQKYDKAKEYYHKALSYKEFLNKDPKHRSLLLDNLAYVNFLSKDTANIPDLFYKALKIRDSIDDQNGIATNTLHLAEYYQSVGNDSIARTYAEQSRDLSLELQKNEELLHAYQILSDVSDSKEGLGYANKYIALNDSLIREERLFRDKFARIRFETDEIVQENQQISRENQILIIAILGLTALFLLGYIIFRQQQSNKELLFAQTQQESNEEIYRLLLNQQIKLEEGRQMEQQRMSEELHDGVLGRLFGVRLSLDGINQRANDGFTEARNKYIDELKAIEKEIRLISHDLGAETLPSDVAYIDAVENLIKDLCEVHKIEFEFNNDEDIDWEGIDDQKKVNFFRILQESMQNIFKHAHADHIKINFDYVDSTINLTILDDGIGFKANKVKKGIGLKNITSRVSQMNGEVQFLSNEGSGTKVSVHVPIEAKVEEVY
ncbi:signal transduction histidine kinase [Aquimarina sp. EL_43]|uniref:tetratricopeptide repeat-containing sensor histidine kinase n=1 Tax=unclassified Aquimarina TaxID=2627091 RepID=UPI0018CB5266|nr:MULTISPECIES: sensor histidine kinase [unclassified Aquimarina]MBG6133286.1 signal transduction histidine kinase [Aquimarina sp. EL_35]MBG6153535.1 signal transduction histidine kinase/Tfp pilus assembly protein PilF [Aquimarina sp. EL_32]MBG6171691.1 signal transduction histidine kinase [Aquimarina sp. EL_43]